MGPRWLPPAVQQVPTDLMLVGKRARWPHTGKIGKRSETEEIGGNKQ